MLAMKLKLHKDGPEIMQAVFEYFTDCYCSVLQKVGCFFFSTTRKKTIVKRIDKECTLDSKLNELCSFNLNKTNRIFT